MNNRVFLNGLIILGAGLLASSVSSFLGAFALFGTATDFVRGLFDGLSVVAFGVAIIVLVRGRQILFSALFCAAWGSAWRSYWPSPI